VLYGSEKAVDMAIGEYRLVEKLQNYNTVQYSTENFLFGVAAGTDYGAPVRQAAKDLSSILVKDEFIRQARSQARSGSDCLVPLGTVAEKPKVTQQISFGEVPMNRVGAGFGIEAIPGMYEGRPERYFDKDDDSRKTKSTGDHQFTREVIFY